MGMSAPGPCFRIDTSGPSWLIGPRINQRDVMAARPTTPDIRKQLHRALLKSLAVPVLLLFFFAAAPAWLNSRLHSAAIHSVENHPGLTDEEKSARLERLSHLDFRQICLDCPPGEEQMHAALEKTGMVANFERLRWGLVVSVLLVAGLAVAAGAVMSLNKKAALSQTALIRNYRLGWKIGMAAATMQIFLLIPLLAYSTFEFSLLLTGHYYPYLLMVIVFGGLAALWATAKILLKNVPLQFNENLAREVTPAEAPELWAVVRNTAIRLQTSPPDRILTGMQFNFYVTELAVNYQGGQTQGKTLYLSLPVLKQLSVLEVIAIIGHELGHFIGEDTRLTREFYPLRLKARATAMAMARSGWVGWPSLQFIHFFALCFAETERATSRRRELLADQKAAAVTNPQTAARALVRFQVTVEAFNRNVRNQARNPLDTPMQTLVQEQLLGEPAFWNQLFEKKLPHPMDTHPPLHLRLASLGQKFGPPEAQAIAQEMTETAYDQWFGAHGHLFAQLNQQAGQAVAKMQVRAEIKDANYQTPAGREILEKHFPKRTWRIRFRSYWAIVALLSLLFMLSLMLATMSVITEVFPHVLFGCLTIVLGWGIVAVFLRNHHGEVTLTAGGLHHTAWKRPLLFKDLNQITARRTSSSAISLIFHLKQKQPPIWKYSLLRFPIIRIGLPLSTLDAKPAASADLIYKYFTRHTGP